MARILDPLTAQSACPPGAVEIIELRVEVQRDLASLPPDDIVRSHDRVKRELKRAAVLQRIQAQAGATPEWPSRRYPVIYADPPWEDDFGFSDHDAANYYPTMPLDDIKALAVADIATLDAVLFLWALPHMVHKALGVLAA